MSARHPIIAVTGSSGAGTTRVKQTFEQIFWRENVHGTFVEGDSFHRYSRVEMQRVRFRPRSAMAVLSHRTSAPKAMTLRH